MCGMENERGGYGMDVVEAQLGVAKELRARLEEMRFEKPVVCVYNPLRYAWVAFEQYVRRYGDGRGRVLFLGMNPGPWGMTQTGVPFGEVAVVRDWLCLDAPIGRPETVHPSYPVDGYECPRSEVSGRRLWGLFRERFGTPERFFEGHFVVNYCPLLFIAEKVLKSGRTGASNLTPDKLPLTERGAVLDACDDSLRELISLLSPTRIVGVGNFAFQRADLALRGLTVKPAIDKILHPSPASPRSNADWAGEATRELIAQGVWE